ncbi:hypothetical protein N7517_004321 [Penicillium concentricum]|uniref:Rhodopsin domain-containing protein n=1 Tax=Penicillium concentricum TaxID=293559 RepID=A0A9W9S6M0_9EURO|nr:uncharacterized protein N7517_004321 [Penicillium concentricum]KAJ5372315.1 hypothetical protein N7517_004321 [Penicillium concentricum]
MASGQDPPNKNISWRILVGTIISIVPATICVILRFVARNVAHAGLWWDDYTIAVSLSFMAVQLLYFTNAVITKASLLFLFYRIFGVVRSFRWILWASGFLVVAYFIVCSVVSIVGCSPVSKAWNTNEPGHCIDELSFFRWNGVGNMFLDFLVLCLPIPMAWRVNTTTRQKYILTGIFLLGGFVCIVSIIRIVSFGSAVISDPTYTSVGPATWSSVEQSVGIICACLPTLRPLFRRLYGPSRAASSRGHSPAFDSQDWSSPSGRMSHCDEETRIIGFASPQQRKRRASSHELDELQSVYRSPTFDGTNERPDSQFSQTNGTNRPVSAAGSFG